MKFDLFFILLPRLKKNKQTNKQQTNKQTKTTTEKTQQKAIKYLGFDCNGMVQLHNLPLSQIPL
jgi:hypothetical protein